MADILKKLKNKGVKKEGKVGRERKERRERKEENRKNVESDSSIQTKYINQIQKQHIVTDTYLKESKMNIYDIDYMSFSVMTKKDMEKLSVCEITNLNKTNDTTSSIEDPRLGTIENNIQCSTCGRSNEDCPGHPGIINLPVSIIHPYFKPFLIKVLQSVCAHCNKLLMSANLIREKGYLNLQGANRLQKIAKDSETLICKNTNCGSNYRFKNDKKDERDYRHVSYIIKRGKVETEGYLPVDRIKQNLNCISEEDAHLMGFNRNHPKNFIIDFIPVIPLSARPYNFATGDKKDNYLSILYEGILSKKLESEQYDNFSNKEENYKEIASIYFDNLIKSGEGTKIKGRQETGKSIDELISKKAGLMRSNVMAKRCNYTNRTVIGSNRKLNFGYLAPPNEMKNITLIDKITYYNKSFYEEYAKQGGIVYLCPMRGELLGIKLHFNLEKHKLHIGDIIHRKLMDGDITIFNRQPTLHRQGILAYVCDFQDKYSVGLHLSSTSGHNADFDGDEGNNHNPQDVEAQMEMRTVMNSKNCIMSFSYSKPEAGLVYNSITGAYLMTKKDLPMSKEYFMRGLEEIWKYTKSDYTSNNFKTLFKRLGKTNYSTISLCSVLFPPDFYYTRENDGKIHVKIVNGILVYGTLTKSDVGSAANSIIQNLWKWYGKEITSCFLSDANFLFNWYITRTGMTISVRDCQPLKIKEFNEDRKNIFNKMNEELNSLPPLIDNSSLFDKQERENKINNILNNAKTEVYKTLSKDGYTEEDNSLFTMYKSGGKGGIDNIANMMATLGQNYIDNDRPFKTLTNGKRWLTTFSILDESPESRGFSYNCYFDGLDPVEYFAQAQSGRIGIISTAIKTADTGYLYRKITKAQEDLVLANDGSVRNQTGMIFQFTYGSGFGTQNSVIDKTIDGDQIYSFFNSKELAGRINTESGFTSNSIKDVIASTTKAINQKYNFGGDDADFEDEEDNERFEDEDDDADDDMEEF